MWIWLAYLLLVPALIVSALLFVGVMVGAYLPNGLHVVHDTLNRLHGLPLLPLLAMNVAMYMVVTLVTLALGAESIRREKTGRTWETLLLTNADARQIVLGKWWATVRAMWRDHAIIIVLRVGLLAWLLSGFHAFMVYPDLPSGVSPVAAFLLLFTLIVTAYTLLDAALSAALGVLGPLVSDHNAIAVTIVFALRTLGIVLTIVLPLWTASSYPPYTIMAYILGAIVVIALYPVLIWGVLRAAQIAAIRQQAAHPSTFIAANAKLVHHTDK
ncbi:MAG: hypothetical protein H7175_24280 [Burkholderiales bacterium]|nr:hypothetical protein [Anaerolineae bacterium]